MEELRKVKLKIGKLNLSFIDISGSLVMGIYLSFVFNKPIYYSLLIFPVGVIAHFLLKIKTPLNNFLSNI